MTDIIRNDLLKLMREGVEAAVPEIIRIQQSGDMGTQEKEDKSKVTLGDSTAQAIYVEAYNKALGENKIYYLNEEDMGAAVEANEARKDTASYRVAFDPIDGTGNYAKGFTRSIDELTADELTRPIANPGFVTQGTIQERQTDGSWKTVAAFTYEPTSNDKPDKMTGRLLMAADGMDGVQVIDYATGQTSTLSFKGKVENPNKVVKGGYLKDAGSPEAEKAVSALVTDRGLTEVDFKCVGQSMLAVTTGKCAAFHQENPNFYDNSSGGYLGEKAGVAVIIVDEYEGKPALVNAKDGKQRFPIFMTTDSNVGMQMLKTYATAKGFDLEKIGLRDGNWDLLSVAEMKTKLGVGVSGANTDIAAAPDKKLQK